MIDQYKKNDCEIDFEVESREALTTRKAKCNERITNIDDKLATIRHYNLAELLLECSNESAFNSKLEAISSEDDQGMLLVKHLITQGFIDESSEKYITRYNPQGLSVGDMRNLALLMRNKASNPMYVFEKPAEILIRLDETHLSIPGVQNYSLLQHLLKTHDEAKIHSFMQGIKAQNHADYLLNYIASPQYHPDIFHYIESEFDDEVIAILNPIEHSHTSLRVFCHKLIQVVPVWGNKRMTDAFNDFAAYDPDFLNIADDLIEETTNGLLKLDTRFVDINFSCTNAEVLDMVYKHNLYEPNISMIKKWVEHLKCFTPTVKSISFADLSEQIFIMNDEPIHANVSKRMDRFISSSLSEISKGLALKEDVLIWILNNLHSDDIGINLLSKLECKLGDLSKVKNQQFQKHLLLLNRTSPNSIEHPFVLQQYRELD